MALSRLETKNLPAEDPAAEVGRESLSPRSYDCDHCGRTFEGVPGGAGLLVWTRGDEIRFEEPPLCDECASKIAIGALLKWDAEEEEEG